MNIFIETLIMDLIEIKKKKKKKGKEEIPRNSKIENN
jgi:hypothetical protein